MILGLKLEPPNWILNNFSQISKAYAIRQFGEKVRKLKDDELPFGANMAFRTSALRGVHFDPRLGRIGLEMLGGEESETFRLIKSKGGYGVWIGTARVQHYIPSNRSTSRYLWSWAYGVGQTRVRRRNGECVKKLLGVPLCLIKSYLRNRVLSCLFHPLKTISG